MLMGAAGEENVNAVADDAEPKEVFSYVDPTDDTETRKYAVLRGENKTDTGTEYTYTNVDVLVDHDADEATAEIAVKARLPEATAYKHIHFGVWAALGEAEKRRFPGTLLSRHWLRPELVGRGSDDDWRR